MYRRARWLVALEVVATVVAVIVAASLRILQARGEGRRRGRRS